MPHPAEWNEAVTSFSAGPPNVARVGRYIQIKTPDTGQHFRLKFSRYDLENWIPGVTWRDWRDSYETAAGRKQC